MLFLSKIKEMHSLWKTESIYPLDPADPKLSRSKPSLSRSQNKSILVCFLFMSFSQGNETNVKKEKEKRRSVERSRFYGSIQTSFRSSRCSSFVFFWKWSTNVPWRWRERISSDHPSRVHRIHRIPKHLWKSLPSSICSDTSCRIPCLRRTTNACKTKATRTRKICARAPWHLSISSGSFFLIFYFILLWWGGGSHIDPKIRSTKQT